MFTFTDALIIAAEAHRGQKDDGGTDSKYGGCEHNKLCEGLLESVIL